MECNMLIQSLIFYPRTIFIRIVQLNSDNISSLLIFNIAQH